MYSTVPQNEKAFLSSPKIESLIRPKSVSLIWPSWSSRMLKPNEGGRIKPERMTPNRIKTWAHNS